MLTIPERTSKTPIPPHAPTTPQRHAAADGSRSPSPGSDPGPEPPTISAAILTNLQPRQREVYRAVFAAGGSGTTVHDLRGVTGLASDACRNQARALVRMRVLKEVQDVRNSRRKLYMAIEFGPADEVSGGTWYHDGRVDADAVAAARRRCLAQVARLGAATVDMIHAGITREEPGAGYAKGRIVEILRTMVLDRSVEEVKSTGEGEFSSIRRGLACYRETGKKQEGGMMEGIPCGVCPMIDECSPEGVISPTTCVYYQRWLQMDF